VTSKKDVKAIQLPLIPNQRMKFDRKRLFPTATLQISRHHHKIHAVITERQQIEASWDWLPAS